MIITKRGNTYLINNNEYYEVYVDGTLVPRSSIRQADTEPKSIYKLENRIATLGWMDKKTGNLISGELYEQLQDDLEEPDEDGDFTSLDNEFAWRKFHNRYSIETERYEEKVPLEFSILEITESEYDDIESYYSLNKALDKSVAEFNYSPNIVGYMEEIAKKYNVTVVYEESAYNKNYKMVNRGPIQLTITSHTCPWEFSKINGNYWLADREAMKKSWSRSFRGSYDGCVAKRNKIYAEVELAFKRQLPQKAKLSDTQVQDALKLVERLKSNQNSVQSLQRTKGFLNNSRKNVKELEDFLNTILEES